LKVETDVKISKKGDTAMKVKTNVKAGRVSDPDSGGQ
jgi:hypothetical protein